MLPWLWVKNMYPKWNPGNWKHGPKPAVPWWFYFDPCPHGSDGLRRSNHVHDLGRFDVVLVHSGTGVLACLRSYLKVLILGA